MILWYYTKIQMMISFIFWKNISWKLQCYFLNILGYWSSIRRFLGLDHENCNLKTKSLDSLPKILCRYPLHADCKRECLPQVGRPLTTEFLVQLVSTSWLTPYTQLANISDSVALHLRLVALHLMLVYISVGLILLVYI